MTSWPQEWPDEVQDFCVAVAIECGWVIRQLIMDGGCTRRYSGDRLEGADVLYRSWLSS